MLLKICVYGEKEKKSHINSNQIAMTLEVVTSSNTNYTFMGAL